MIRPAPLVASVLVALSLPGAAGWASSDAAPPIRRVPDAAPGWSPDGRYLRFSRGYSSFVARADGTRARRMGYLTSPIWSPDAKRLLLFDSKLRIRMARPDGSGARFLRRGERPSWSPDGTAFVYTWNREMVVHDSAGSELRRIPIGRGNGCPPEVCVYFDHDARWSPAGDAIAFVHVTVWTASKGSSSLRMVDPRGTTVQDLPSRFAVGNVAWSPTGEHIAFIQNDEFEDDVLHVIDLANRRNTRVARGWDFEWSPRGDMLVLFGNVGYDGPNYAEIVRLRDGWRRRLPGVRNVSWSPDGRRIAFERKGGIWLADRFGNHQRRIATGTWPAWSPRGDVVAFAAAACGPRQGIWLLRVATGASRRVTRGCRAVR